MPLDQSRPVESASFIIHNYTRAESCLSPVSSKAIIDVGRYVIDSAHCPTGWTNVNWNFDTSIFNTSGKSFTFSRTPPSYKGQEPRSYYALKDWGAPISGDSAIVVDDLPEFESTDLGYLLSFGDNHTHSKSLSRKSAGYKDTAVQIAIKPSSMVLSDSGQRPAKRRRLDDKFLHNIVPQPHYHPSLSVDYPPVDTSRITPYKKSHPVPIPPYDTSKVEEYLITPYMRSAWIIPVRGTLPWEDSTPALMLDSSESVPPSGPAPNVSSNRQDRRITWTHASLISFWNFLLAIRQAKTLGPISVSFNATSSRNFSIVSGTSSGNRETDLEDISKTSPPVVFRTTLFMVDHIKVYHDVACTMRLRNALDAWSYQYRAEGGLGGGACSEFKAGTEVDGGDGKRQKELSSAAETKTRKIRMLKGAVLVLVDDSSNGVLLS